MISSPSFRQINYLSELKHEDNIFFYCNAVIIGWEPNYDDELYYFARTYLKTYIILYYI